MPVRFLPDQPHKYFNREVTIVGYPGEKNPKEMYAHSCPIKKVYPQGTVLNMKLIHPEETVTLLVF